MQLQRIRHLNPAVVVGLVQSDDQLHQQVYGAVFVSVSSSYCHLHRQEVIAVPLSCHQPLMLLVHDILESFQGNLFGLCHRYTWGVRGKTQRERSSPMAIQKRMKGTICVSACISSILILCGTTC